MNDKHVVLGAGPVGRAVVEQLVARGAEVVLVNRSGRGTPFAGVRREGADITDTERHRVAKINSKIRTSSSHIAIDYTISLPPLEAWSYVGLRGLHPKCDGKIILYWPR